MTNKRHKPEEIVPKLRQVEVLVGQGMARVIHALADLFILRRPPAYIRSDNGPGFVAKAVRDWIVAAGAKSAYIAPRSPWENGCCESFNARLRDELLGLSVVRVFRREQALW